MCRTEGKPYEEGFVGYAELVAFVKGKMEGGTDE
jgi:hypothetical protein